jgi:dihydroflavonol-4-reductase
MRVFVTGATGVVGAALVRELLARGHEVTALVRARSDLRPLAELKVRLQQGDVLDYRSLAAAMTGCTVVFHAAAVFAYWSHTPEAVEQVAVEGTRNVLRAAAASGVQRVVVTSSSVVFGSSTTPLPRKEDDPFHDPDPQGYAVAKFHQHQLALQMGAMLKLELILACPTLVLGPNDYRLGTSNAIVVNYLNDPSRSTFLGGCNVAASEDIARGHVLLAEKGTPGQSYLLGGENLTWHDLHRTISQACQLDGPWLTLNHTASYVLAWATQMYARFSGAAPVATLDQARMVGRYYWYDHGKASRLGYTAAGARATVAGALRWLLQTEHVNRFVRAVIQMPDPAVEPSCR